MGKNIYKINKISQTRPPKALFEIVSKRISQERKLKQLKRRLFFYTLAFTFSLILCLISLFWSKSQFSKSGFFEYLSLIYFDFNIVLTYWQDFALTLLEILPISGLVSVLLVGVVSYYLGQKLKESVIDLKTLTHQA